MMYYGLMKSITEGMIHGVSVKDDISELMIISEICFIDDSVQKKNYQGNPTKTPMGSIVLRVKAITILRTINSITRSKHRNL